MSKIGAVLQVGRTFGVRDGMLRLQYELRRSSGLMSWKMRSAEGWDSWSLQRIAPGSSAEQMRDARRDGTRRFFFRDAPALRSSLQDCVGFDGAKAVIARAENILEGKLPFFGQLSCACGFPPQWFRNPVTGQSVSPRQAWTQMRFASPVYGDLKFILEPSRFLFVYQLVRAYALTGDERFPHAFWSAIEDWSRHSPPMAGPLWICGQECSLRILAWSFALHAFINSPSTTNRRVALLVSMIAAHAWRTAQTLGYARSQRSNHLICEAVGLWTTGTLYPELREAQVWRNLGAHLLREAILDQITAEGVSQQHSFNYQRMILHMLLWTLRLAEIHGDDASLHEPVRERTVAAFEFMRAWVDAASGLAPNYGSNDGSLIFPLAEQSYGDFRPLMQLGAAVLDRPSLSPGPWDEAALWFGITPSAVVKSPSTSPPSVETGYFRLGDERSWALIRAGRYTRRPFQADQLQVDLWWRGMNLARDPGTYLYNGLPPWNNGLASTAVHNTITIDHRDQMRSAGRFLWLDWAQAAGRSQCLLNQNFSDHFEGEHDGYKRLGVICRRMVQWLQGAGWVIVDDIEGIGEHNVRLHWLVNDLPHEVFDAPFRAFFRADQSRVRWNMFASSTAAAVVIRAGKRLQIETQENSVPQVDERDFQLLGWESPAYGELTPAVSLIHETQAQLPVRLVTVILTEEQCHLESRDNLVRIFQDESEEDKFEIYRVSLAARGKSVKAPLTRMNAVKA